MSRPVRQRKPCVDCAREGITTKRKTPHPGPRCASHHRAKKRARRDYSHSTHILELYGITSEQYQAIYEYQGGKCAICQRATGFRKRLSVDHCHETGEIRLLACSPCNRMLGHLRDDPTAFERAAECLRNPPARVALGGIHFVPSTGAPVRPGINNRAGAKPIITDGGEPAA